LSGFRGRGRQHVDQLDFECKALTSTGTVSGPGQFLGAVGGGGGSSQGPYGCATGNPAYALHGTAGTNVDGFGIQCRRAALSSAPSIVNPGNQSGTVGVAVDLQISASDPNGDVLSYGASGLPPGLGIGTSTGRVSGTPTTAGTYEVMVTVSDGSASDSATLGWSVFPSGPFLLHPLPPNPPQPVETPVSFTASTSNGVNQRGASSS
jgi:hypothetical protein